MYNELIKKYINLVTKDKILEYSKKNNISLSNSEIDILYDTIQNQNNIDILLSNQYNKVFQKIRPYLREENYLKILNLFKTYKNKFNIN